MKQAKERKHFERVGYEAAYAKWPAVRPIVSALRGMNFTNIWRVPVGTLKDFRMQANK